MADLIIKLAAIAEAMAILAAWISLVFGIFGLVWLATTTYLDAREDPQRRHRP